MFTNRLKAIDMCMNMILKGFLVIGFLVTVNLSVFAIQNEVISMENSNLTQGKELFFKARKMFYNAEAPFSEINTIFNRSKEAFNNLVNDYDKYYWLAQVAFVMAETAEISGDKQQAAHEFTESGNLIRKALTYNSKSSDANRILADTFMRLMSYKGAMYMMSQGPHAFKLLNNALNLDKKNFSAMNSFGMYYLNAPAFGGGNIDKGLQILQEALESKDEYDNFISYVWLGKGFQMKKNDDEAVKYYHKALEIYPNSPWAKGFLKEVEYKQ